MQPAAGQSAFYTQLSVIGCVADGDVQLLRDRLGALTGILIPKPVDDVVHMYQPYVPSTKAKKSLEKGAVKPLPGRVILTLEVPSGLWTIEHFGDRQKTPGVKAMTRKIIRLPSTKEDGRKFMEVQGQKLGTVLRKKGVEYKWACDAANNGYASVTIARVEECQELGGALPASLTDPKIPWMVELVAHARADTLQEIGDDVFRKSQHLGPSVVWNS